MEEKDYSKNCFFCEKILDRELACFGCGDTFHEPCLSDYLEKRESKCKIKGEGNSIVKFYICPICKQKSPKFTSLNISFEQDDIETPNKKLKLEFLDTSDFLENNLDEKNLNIRLKNYEKRLKNVFSQIEKNNDYYDKIISEFKNDKESADLDITKYEQEKNECLESIEKNKEIIKEIEECITSLEYQKDSIDNEIKNKEEERKKKEKKYNDDVNRLLGNIEITNRELERNDDWYPE